MKEYTNFDEFYNDCILIVQKYHSYGINYIRKNLDRNILNSYYCVGDIPFIIMKILGSNTKLLKLSTDNLIKNLIEHPELSLPDYKNIPLYLRNAEYILKKNDKNLIYFKIDNHIYQFVIKRTIQADEVFITTFHKASKKQLEKDLKRYLNIKKDSPDCEDSKYPSVT